MNDLLEASAAILGDSGFHTRHAEILADSGKGALETLAFEDGTVIGFVLVYETATELIQRWKADGDRVAMRNRKALQAAQQKAWNAYLVLVSRAGADFGEALALGQIEEDLEAMRKITKSGVTGAVGVRGALLPLLPFRAAPSLDPIDMHEEILLRTTELDGQAVAAFLSGAEESVVMQLLEDRT